MSRMGRSHDGDAQQRERFAAHATRHARVVLTNSYAMLRAMRLWPAESNVVRDFGRQQLSRGKSASSRAIQRLAPRWAAWRVVLAQRMPKVIGGMKRVAATSSPLESEAAIVCLAWRAEPLWKSPGKAHRDAAGTSCSLVRRRTAFMKTRWIGRFFFLFTLSTVQYLTSTTSRPHATLPANSAIFSVEKK
mmetsp:Transcript_26390/g.83896  ORF Transcript_26390/g.83896 Transcript_26390/m.83896 type:complete len:190 (-) Transcript_26390:846-1415(-)